MNTEKTVLVNGESCRVIEQGSGKAIGFVGGFLGLPRLPKIVTHLAETHKVIVPSLPGFPGGLGHDKLDTHLDWILAMRDLWLEAGLEGADAVGVSVGGSLLAEMAGLWPGSVGKLVLLAPFGWYDENNPPADPFAVPFNQLPSMLVANPASAEVLLTAPAEADPVMWRIMLIRATEAGARILWPLGETGLMKRLPRIKNPTLLLWGSEDRLLPPAYANAFAEQIGQHASVSIMKGAGHLAGLDQPEEMAELVTQFFY